MMDEGRQEKAPHRSSFIHPNPFLLDSSSQLRSDIVRSRCP
jgi:hypothetical protein